MGPLLMIHVDLLFLLRFSSVRSPACCLATAFLKCSSVAIGRATSWFVFSCHSYLRLIEQDWSQLCHVEMEGSWFSIDQNLAEPAEINRRRLWFQGSSGLLPRRTAFGLGLDWRCNKKARAAPACPLGRLQVNLFLTRMATPPRRVRLSL